VEGYDSLDITILPTLVTYSFLTVRSIIFIIWKEEGKGVEVLKYLNFEIVLVDIELCYVNVF
jgi:hypothetical protein